MQLILQRETKERGALSRDREQPYCQESGNRKFEAGECKYMKWRRA